jgi:hypothetical protein
VNLSIQNKESTKHFTFKFWKIYRNKLLLNFGKKKLVWQDDSAPHHKVDPLQGFLVKKFKALALKLLHFYVATCDFFISPRK